MGVPDVAECLAQVRLSQYILRQPESDLRPVQKQHVSCVVKGDVPVVGNHQYRGRPLALIFLEKVVQVGGSGDVYTRGRLIEHDEFRPPDQATSQKDPLQLSA